MIGDRSHSAGLVELSRLATVGELAAGAAHEINNPLFAILGLVEFLLLDAPAGSKTHERLLLVQETGLEIKEIVHGLVGAARDHEGEPATFDLRDVAAAAVGLIRRTGKGVAVFEHLGSAPLLVRGSRTQVRDVLLQLLSSARSAARAGDCAQTLTVTLAREGSRAILAIDGAPALEHGLRLDLGRALVEGAGGTLTVGSRITISLPLEVS